MTETDQRPAELKGIDGWLIWPLIGLILGSLVHLWHLVKWLAAITTHISAHLLTTQTAAQVLALPVFAFSIFCLVRFLQKRREVPWLMTVLYGADIAIGLMLILYRLKGYSWPDDRAALLSLSVRTGVKTAIDLAWIFYFHTSVRVANTFTVEAPKRAKREPKGLGGWLILPLATIIVLAAGSLFGMVKSGVTTRMLFAFQHGHWLVLCRQTFLIALVIGGSSACLVYALRQKRIARWLLTVYFGLWIVVIVGTLARAPKLNYAGVFLGLLCLAILAYLLLSRRVKNTFVR